MADTHFHLCKSCQHYWEHVNGAEDGHRCPRCGEGPWLSAFACVSDVWLERYAAKRPKREAAAGIA